MSRSRTRARARRAHQNEVRAEFARKREDPAALSEMLRRLAGSDLCVWRIAEFATTDNPLDEEERAMIAQIVSPNLAGMTPGEVHKRHKRAK